MEQALLGYQVLRLQTTEDELSRSVLLNDSCSHRGIKKKRKGEMGNTMNREKDRGDVSLY